MTLPPVAEQDCLPIGHIHSPFGMKGWVNVVLYNPDTELIQPDRTLFLQNKKGRVEPTEVLNVIEGNRFLRVRFSTIEDRNQAEAIGKPVVLARKADLPPLDDPLDYYWFELAGFTVKDTADATLGKITQVNNFGAQDVISVKPESKREILIPLAEEILISIDRDQKIMVVDPPPGLVDLEES